MDREDIQAPPVGEARSKLGVVLGTLLALGLVSGAGWVGTDRLEQRNEFCNACHLDGWLSGTPLHTEHRDQFAATSPQTLAGAHAIAGMPARTEAPAFLCIDCHGGVGLAGRARVKALAAKDAFWWVVGNFEEPEGMHWPLREEDCRQCHSSFTTKAGEFEDPAFHDLGVHNRDLGIDCVECHEVHVPQAQTNRWFIDAFRVRKQCARCHSAMAP